MRLPLGLAAAAFATLVAMPAWADDDGIGKIEEAGNAGFGARASPVKLAGQQPLHGIGHAQELFEAFGRNFFETNVGGPVVFGAEIPFGQR